MAKKKNIILALPGRTYSGEFMTSLLETVATMMQQGYGIRVVNEYSSFVTFSRMKTLGLSVFEGRIKNHRWKTRLRCMAHYR